MKYTVLESQLPVTDEEYLGNLRVNLERGFPRCIPMPERENSNLAIVGSGPSVRDYLDEIRNFDGHVWAINGAYNYLQDHGIMADGFVGCDPLPGLDDYLKRPHQKTTFYIAGTCDPTTFDPVIGYDIKMWFLQSGLKYPPGLWVVIGGTTAMLRSPFLAWMQGYRDLTFYGADSSHDPNGRYCYDDGTYKWDSDAPINWVRTSDGKGPFPTEVALMKQVAQFHAIKELYKAKITVRCGGLMDAFLKAPMQPELNLNEEDDAA